MNVGRLSDLDFDELSTFLQEIGEPAFRSQQAWQWMSQKGVFDLARMNNLPAKMRHALAQRFSLPPLTVEESPHSDDGTEKTLFKLTDGRFVEAVLIPAPDRMTVCLSSQVGCAVGCNFCASGLDGGKRNLSRGEIFEQFMMMKHKAELKDRKVTNIVVMGMGEPMFNYENVIQALDRINSEDGPHVGARRITVSTVGIRSGVERFTAAKKPYNLAFSLHAPNDRLRQKIVPLKSAMSVAEIRAAAIRHLKETGREVTFEYVMLKGINDGHHEARELRALMRNTQASINLIPYNPVESLPFARPDDEAIDTFADLLESAGVHVSVRRRKGSDIDAACGQLALKHRLKF